MTNVQLNHPSNEKFIRVEKKDLKIMRNEISAKNGYIFKATEMKSYFATQSWYSGQYDDVISMLSGIEKQRCKINQEV